MKKGFREQIIQKSEHPAKVRIKREIMSTLKRFMIVGFWISEAKIGWV
jgi:hypothetical protein